MSTPPCVTYSPAGPISCCRPTSAARSSRDLAAHHPLQLHLKPQQATAYVFLNVRRPPLNDVRVRRALNYAVDRARVAALHGAGLAQPTCQVVPPTAPGYRPYCPYTAAPDAGGGWKAPDETKARALIRASGTRGQTIVVWSFPYFHRESQYFVSLLRRLGYRARLHYVPDFNAYFTALARTPTAQAGFVGWFDVPLAVDMLDAADLPRPPGADWAHFCDPARRLATRTTRARRPGLRWNRGACRENRPGGHRSGALGAPLHPSTPRPHLEARRRLRVPARLRAARPALGSLARTRPPPVGPAGRAIHPRRRRMARSSCLTAMPEVASNERVGERAPQCIAPLPKSQCAVLARRVVPLWCHANSITSAPSTATVGTPTSDGMACHKHHDGLASASHSERKPDDGRA